MTNLSRNKLLDKKGIKRVGIQTLINDSHLLAKFNDDLIHGAVCVIPTDTMYGFAADANHTDAISKIYSIKNRSKDKPLILFISKFSDLDYLGLNVLNDLRKQLTNYWPGALTAIIKIPTPTLSLIQAFNFSSIGIRMPHHDKLLYLLNQYSSFLLTTSVNRSGQPPLLNPDTIEKEFGDEIDWLLEDGEYDKVATPSTIVDFTNLSPTILRQGKQSFHINLPDKL